MLYLYIDNLRLNKLTIKNNNLLTLINMLLNCSSYIKYFT